jgi:hypothetical protein
MLRSHQIESVNSLVDVLKNHNSALDASDTGTGKTFVACAVAQRLKLPTLAVVPKIAISSWKRVCDTLGESLSIINYEKLRTGNTPYGRWNTVKPAQEYLVCQCCQQKITDQKCYVHPLGIHCAEVKRKPAKYGNFVFDPAVKFLIFDESQRCNGMKSLNSEMLVAAVRQDIKHLMLSATPADSILKMRALGYSLGLHGDKHAVFTAQGIKPAFHSWLRPLGVRPHPAFRGLLWMEPEASQREIMARINQQIIPSRGVRVTTEQIPDFPEREISAELYDLDKNNEIDRLYAEMSDALAELEGTAASDKDPEHPFTKILRAQQKIELLKVPIAEELSADSVEKGFSVGLFVKFRQTIDELADRLKCDCIIDGSVTGADRDRAIARFQSNECRIIIINSEAGGSAISLQDLDGNYPRVGYVMPGYSATSFIQLAGRFHREGGKSKCFYRVLLVARTVEEKIWAALNRKRNNLSALTDADFLLPKSENR